MMVALFSVYCFVGLTTHAAIFEVSCDLWAVMRTDQEERWLVDHSVLMMVESKDRKTADSSVHLAD
jgi:hypothetical protein